MKTIKLLSQNKYVRFFLKLLGSFLCVFLVFRKINYAEVSAIVRYANVLYLLPAVIFFILSKLISAIRLQRYLLEVPVTIGQLENIKLYWLGMFYNLFLPGGIGGDAYKGYYLKKRFEEVKLKNIIIVLLKDRLSGLVALFVLLLLLLRFIEIPLLAWYLFGATLLVGLGLYWVEKKLPPDTSKSLFFTVSSSFLVQITQLVSVFFIVYSLNCHDSFAVVAFVFLLSTIAAMVPFSLGGIGLRELTFMYFADFFHYNKEVSVTIAFLFFLITAGVSLPGIYYHFRKDKMRGA